MNDRLSQKIDSPTYPERWYNLTALGWIGLSIIAGAIALYFYLIQGDWIAGVLALLVGVLYAALARITQILGEVKA